jgi:hypothetical protein
MGLQKQDDEPGIAQANARRAERHALRHAEPLEGLIGDLGGAWIAYGAGSSAQAAGGRPMASRKAANRCVGTKNSASQPAPLRDASTPSRRHAAAISSLRARHAVAGHLPLLEHDLVERHVRDEPSQLLYEPPSAGSATLSAKRLLER